MYTAIGDSLTVGKGSGLFSPGYVERFSAELSQLSGQQVFPHKFAHDGATAEEIFSSTYQPPIAFSLKDSNYITITSGGNDLIQGGKTFLKTKQVGVIQQAIQKAIYNNRRILEHLHALKETNGTTGPIYLFNMYNPFPQIQVADEGIRAYNGALEHLSAFPNVRIVDIYRAFYRRPYLLSNDGVHPNSEGYAVMAQALLYN